jgi:lysophospholipase L1-like esterase
MTVNRTMLAAVAIVLASMLVACRRSAQPEPTVSVKESRRAIERFDDGVVRVVVVGDSLAYGTGDESRKGISGRLEEELRRRGLMSVEVLNLGVNGATTNSVAERLKKQETRGPISTADAIVLSAGANDLFERRGAQEEILKSPFVVAERILVRLESIVTELRRLNPDAHIFLLGGYNPVPKHSDSVLIDQYLDIWDQTLASRFERDPRISVVRLSDIINGPERLSRLDHFHPGGAAYAEAAKRIASKLLQKAA